MASAAAQLLDEFGDDLVGLLFAGSAAYGTPLPNSDVDLYVLIRPNWRQRRNRLVDGVEVEMFINPASQIRRELDARLPATVDMFARGRAPYDPHGVVAELSERAKQLAMAPPEPPGAAELYFIRYRPADLLRDVEDLVGHDRAAAQMLLNIALQTVLEAFWHIQGTTPPRAKRLVGDFRTSAPGLVRHVEQITDPGRVLEHRVALLRELGELILEPVGGLLLEGETPREHLPETPHEPPLKRLPGTPREHRPETPHEPPRES